MFEIWTFRLRSGVSEAAFLAADKRFQTGFSYQQPGLVRSTTATGDDGRRMILRMWSSRADADAARAAMSESNLATALTELIDEASSTVEFFAGLD